jgi:hypothetical protein
MQNIMKCPVFSSLQLLRNKSLHETSNYKRFVGAVNFATSQNLILKNTSSHIAAGPT